MPVLLEPEGIDRVKELPEPIRLLLAIGLYEISPYSWDKIAELLGFNPLAMKEKLRATGARLYKLNEEEARAEAETSHSL